MNKKRQKKFRSFYRTLKKVTTFKAHKISTKNEKTFFLEGMSSKFSVLEIQDENGPRLLNFMT